MHETARYLSAKRSNSMINKPERRITFMGRLVGILMGLSLFFKEGFMSKKNICLLLAAVSLALAPARVALAGHADRDTKALNGKIRCGGNNFLRLDGREVHFTSYVLRNYNSDFGTGISIDRLRFFDARGTMIPLVGFPPFENGVLGPGDQVLRPNETAVLHSNDVLPFLRRNERPIQLEIRWSAVGSDPVLTLEAAVVRQSRARNPGTGDQGEQRSSHLYECRTIGPGGD